MAKRGSSTAICSASKRFFSPPEKPTFSGRFSISCADLQRLGLARASSFSSSGAGIGASPRALRCALSAAFRKRNRREGREFRQGTGTTGTSPPRALLQGQAPSRSSPFNVATPLRLVAFCGRTSAYAKVDLPEPFGPMSACVSPGGHAQRQALDDLGAADRNARKSLRSSTRGVASCSPRPCAWCRRLALHNAQEHGSADDRRTDKRSARPAASSPLAPSHANAQSPHRPAPTQRPTSRGSPSNSPATSRRADPGRKAARRTKVGHDIRHGHASVRPFVRVRAAAAHRATIRIRRIPNLPARAGTPRARAPMHDGVVRLIDAHDVGNRGVAALADGQVQLLALSQRSRATTGPSASCTVAAPMMPASLGSNGVNVLAGRRKQGRIHRRQFRRRRLRFAHRFRTRRLAARARGTLLIARRQDKQREGCQGRETPALHHWNISPRLRANAVRAASSVIFRDAKPGAASIVHI